MLRKGGALLFRWMYWHPCLSWSQASTDKGPKASRLSSTLLNLCLCLWPCLCLWELYVRTDVVVLTNFTTALVTNIFPTTSVLSTCFLFCFSASSKCFYYEQSDENFLYWALFQSWVPCTEHPWAINYFVPYHYNPRLEHHSSVEWFSPEECGENISNNFLFCLKGDAVTAVSGGQDMHLNQVHSLQTTY